MRLHELQVTAFGPFAGTVAVDFDALGAAGLFLLTGATGAGKTSVLDAVCFGLYGEVPGDRAGARQLHSDHADADAEPRVVLRFSVGQRSFRFSRSPAWERPKRRGHGTRRIQASVVAEELRDGTWTSVTTRLDETGQLVGELLGMTCAQFTQVALLPQGRFQAFLRAPSPERHALLQRLFRTTRFDDVERWLGEQRRQARTRTEAAHAGCLAVLDRVCEVAAAEPPEAWQVRTPAGLGTVADDGSLATWVRGLGDAAVAEQQEQERLLALADRDHDRAARALGEAEASAALRTRGLAAERHLGELEAEAPDVEATERRLDRHRAALPLVPLARRVQHAATTAAHARAAAEQLRPRLTASVGPDLGTSVLEQARDEVGRRHALAGSWLPRERELTRLRDQVHRAERRSDDLAERLRLGDARLGAAEQQVARLARERETVATSSERVARCLDEAERIVAARDAAVQLEQVRAELAAAVSEQHRLADDALAAREHYLELRELRIAGMAAELATGLAAGCSCPVCGSVEHPSPAHHRDRVRRDDEDAARAAHESAEVLRQAAAETVAALRSRVTALEAATGGHDVAEWERRDHDARVALQQATADRDRRDEIDELLAAGSEQRADLVAELATCRAELAATTAETADLHARVASLDAELSDLLAGDGPTPGGTTSGRGTEVPCDSVTTLLEQLDARRVLLDDGLDRLRAAADATVAEAQARATAEESLRSTDFDDVDACLAAVLPTAAGEEAEARVRAWHEARRRAEHVLGDPEVRAALGAHHVDVEEAGRVARRRRDVRDLHLAASRACHAQVERLVELQGDLESALGAWAPLRARHDTLASLTSLVEGTSADNAWRMRLSGYVLAERLRQVVAAANVRLAAMTDQRFALEQTDEKGAGERRGGLSLRVRDDWSATVRDPATLSGGESFVVSLALALGLADTVSHEAGGTAIETLFVDEGFGALDDDTLDAVMDVLDSLRDGGRVVGIVSHVAELRARVTAQLEVRKSRDGSTVGPVLQRA